MGKKHRIEASVAAEEDSHPSGSKRAKKGPMETLSDAALVERCEDLRERKYEIEQELRVFRDENPWHQEWGAPKGKTEHKNLMDKLRSAELQMSHAIRELDKRGYTADGHSTPRKSAVNTFGAANISAASMSMTQLIQEEMFGKRPPEPARAARR
eukprot:gnl/TRDRNA2_/TRDRNA2_126479_c0_seq1.p1 gnl/TRDRNA2_/TRDRNA2_126479_c0~~gnl/TRDRNA2_/TRDRNA2_126479_c0_seq1.p1  ORF type:complete len:155 (-),score=29.62 gnl/TRDRNA2_/TRDRNA2_126479_c0_seq1:85-549(-)